MKRERGVVGGISLVPSLERIRSFLSLEKGTRIKDYLVCVRGAHDSGKSTIADNLYHTLQDVYRIILIRFDDDVAKLEQVVSPMERFFGKATHTVKPLLVLLDMGIGIGSTSEVVRNLRALRQRVVSSSIRIVVFELHGTETYYPAIKRVRESLLGTRSISRSCGLLLYLKTPPAKVRIRTVASSALPLLQRALTHPKSSTMIMEDMTKEMDRSKCLPQIRHLVHVNYDSRTDDIEDASAIADLLSSSDYHKDRANWTPLLAASLYFMKRDYSARSNLKMTCPRHKNSLHLDEGNLVNKEYIH